MIEKKIVFDFKAQIVIPLHCLTRYLISPNLEIFGAIFPKTKEVQLKIKFNSGKR